jgi:pimeloyl-ACP methyl ester carboxylesterase
VPETSTGYSFPAAPVSGRRVCTSWSTPSTYRARHGWSTYLAAIAVASAPWNFTAEFVAVGAELLARMPYNGSAVSWSDDNFDDTYQSTWWPTFIPTLIVSGSDDRVVAQTSWSEPRFSGPNVVHRTIQGGAHFPWIERPDAVRAAFSEFSELLTR